MVNDVLLNKAAAIERCLQRIREEYIGHESELVSNYTKQDSIILNLQRACETAIDMAAHVVRLKQLGLPQTSADVFVLLEKAAIIPADLSHHLQKMVGFRNIAVHEYMTLDLDIVKAIIETHLKDFLHFSKLMLQAV